MSRKSIRVLTTIIAVAALTGCSTSRALSKAELITQGDELCTQSNADVEELGMNELGAPSADNMAQYAEALGKAIPLFEQLIADISALEPPQADKATITEMIGHLQDEVDAIKEAQKAAAAGDLDGFTAAAQRTSEADVPASQMATDYGFKVCGT